MKAKCDNCKHNNKFWQGAGCNLLNNGEKCNFVPLTGWDLFLILARECGYDLSSPDSRDWDEIIEDMGESGKVTPEENEALDPFSAELVRRCREDGMSEEEIKKWLKEL